MARSPAGSPHQFTNTAFAPVPVFDSHMEHIHHLMLTGSNQAGKLLIPVGHEFFDYDLGVGIIKNGGTTLIAQLAFGTLHHAMALIGLSDAHFAAGGDGKALFAAAFGFELWHINL